MDIAGPESSLLPKQVCSVKAAVEPDRLQIAPLQILIDRDGGGRGNLVLLLKPFP